MDYKEQISHPKWQKKRLEILERDEFKCRYCNNSNSSLHVHHLVYHKNKKIWEYENNLLITYCKDCHNRWHNIKENINSYLAVDLDKLEEIATLLDSVNYITPKKIRVISDFILIYTS